MYSGSDNPDDVAWYYGNSDRKKWPVGQKQPNELGLFDMSGNVGEWCSDWIAEYTAEDQVNPKGPSKGEYRVFRAGGYNQDASSARITMRRFAPPTAKNGMIGLLLLNKTVRIYLDTDDKNQSEAVSNIISSTKEIPNLAILIS